MKKIFYWAAIPLVVGILAVLFNQAAGPFWLSFNSDPAYIYLFNFLYLLDKLPLINTYHPGLTLDILGACTIKFFHPFLSHKNLLLNVMQNTEFYLHAFWDLLTLMYAGSLWLLGWYAYKRSQDIFFALLVQLSSLFILAVPSSAVDMIMPVMANVKAETVLVTLNNLLMVGLLKLYWDGKVRSGNILAVALGALCACGVFTKYTFILNLFLVFFLLRGMAGRFWFLLSFIVLGTVLYNVETDPYHRILVYFINLIFKSGTINTMSDRFIDPGEFSTALKSLISQNVLLFLTAALGVIVGIRKHERVLWMTSGMVLAQFLMIAKHANPHYIITAVGLWGLMAALIYDKYRRRISPRLLGAIMAVFVVVNIFGLVFYLQELSANNKAKLAFAQSLSTDYPDWVICPYYPSSSLMLNFADWTNDMHTYYNDTFKNLYPKFFYYDTNAHDFKDFQSRWVPFSEIASGHKGILLYGYAMGENFFKPYTAVHEIAHIPEGDALYAVISQQSPHAAEYFQLSLMLFSQKQYLQALQYGIYAKQLGLPGDIGAYLNQIVAHLRGSQL